MTVASRIESSVDLVGLVEDAFGSSGKDLASAAGKAARGIFGAAARNLVGEADASSLDLLLLGQPATLVINSPQAPPRLVQDIRTEIERLGLLGGESSDWLGYRLILRPRLWLATLRQNSRIFQDSTARDIITILLKEHSIPFSWSGGSILPVRAVTVQYQETDCEFVKRLLAELGSFFYLEPPHGLAEEIFGGAFSAGIAQAEAAFGGPLGHLANVVGSTERMIIADCSFCYSPVACSNASDPWGELSCAAGAAAGALARSASTARELQGSCWWVTGQYL